MLRVFAIAVSVYALSASAQTQRFALVVGNNAGSGDLPSLRYAEHDAAKIAQLFLELGDIQSDRLILLQGQNVSAIEAAVARLRLLVAQAKKSAPSTIALFFYFSGHSDGESLEVGSTGLPYTRLATLLTSTGADVRVLVVDACRSGIALREKGGKAVEAFSTRLTDSLEATGEVLIASSAADEQSLESSEVMGSVFTHHFVSGLRGAADTSLDRRVTLAEAYGYAHDHTVARTALLSAGVQHPTYDYRLQGQGDLVLTTLAKASSTLVFPPEVERGLINDSRSERVVAETPRGATRVALPSGTYGVQLLRDGNAYGGRVTLREGDVREVRWGELSLIPSASMTMKGPRAWEAQRVLTVLGGVAPSVGSIGVLGTLRAAFEPRQGWGFSFALLGSYSRAGVVSELGVDGRVGYRFSWRWSVFWLGAGLEAGPGVIVQRAAASVGSSVTGTGAARVGIRVLLGQMVVLGLEAEAAALLAGTNEGLRIFFRPAALAGVGWRF